MEKLTGILVIGLLRGIALLPWPAVQALGRFSGWLMYRIPNKSTNVARQNLRHCFPELNQQQLEQLVQDSLKNIGQSLTESACAWIWPPHKTMRLIKEVEGLELLQQARAEGKAIVGITSHLGNWEVLNHYYCEHGGNPVIFYRPPKLKALDDLLAKQRTQMGNRVAPSTKEGIISVIKEVRRGGAVGIPADPEPSRSAGVFVPLLATTALTSKFVPGMLLGKQDSVAAIFLHAIRLPNGAGFKVIIEAAPDEMYQAPVEQATAAMSKVLEGYLRQWPQQYMWTMKRFRRRPDGEPEWY